MSARIATAPANAEGLGWTVGKSVVRLPTASRRQVQQACNKQGREHRAAFKRANPWPGEYVFPGIRAARSMAESIKTVGRTPELCIVFAMLATMDRIERAKIMAALNEMGERNPDCESTRSAGNLIAATLLTYGEQNDLGRAMDSLEPRP